MPAPEILVTGGTGHLGRAVVAQLQRDGHPVRILSRRPAPATLPTGTSWARGDLGSGEGVDAAVTDTGAVVHCATSPRLRDVPHTGRLVDAARRAGGPPLVYVSIVGIDGMSFAPYRMKARCEQVVAGSGLPWTTLRATQFHYLVAGMFGVQRRLPFVAVPKGVRVQPINVRDVARRLVALATAPPAGRVDDLGGPEVAPVEQLARTYLQLVARPRRLVSVPVPGSVGRKLRAGSNLAPDHADGTITFEEYVREQLHR